MRGFFITGTDTGVGKTACTAGLAANLKQRGFDVGIMKPVQTGSEKTCNGLVSVDALFTMIVAEISDPVELVSPYRLEPPLAPSIAAQISGVNIEVHKIDHAYRELCKRHRFMLVEGAGGIMVPVTGRFLMADLVKMLNLPVLIVARPGLGTVNHTLLTIEYAKSRDIQVAGIIINGLNESEAGPAEKTNPGLIEELSGVPVVGIIPYDADLDVDTYKPGRITELVGAGINWEKMSLPGPEGDNHGCKGN
ncbi:MAG: dethiobiotin synthase [Firmicutes bacterium]|nr:dethiobiotin synthase [Bacillota bacterium]